MHNIKNLVTKRNRNYNTTRAFVSKINLLVICKTILKMPKLITRKSCAVSYWKSVNHGLINWIINGEMVNEKFCVGILLIRCISSVFSWQWL